VRRPPKVRVRVGPAVPLAHEDPDADTERIMAAIVDLLPSEAQTAHHPTAEELARTFPPGHHEAADGGSRTGTARRRSR
jgi:putative phosphoserine phosphatase/1-acylglycerol-3-phosphate O-acyltransferase